MPLRLVPPSRLVGRDEQVATLEAAFDDASAGGCRGVLVAGAPGVGKTALIDQLRSVVTGRDGWFVAGKFDQYRRDLEFDAVQPLLVADTGADDRFARDAYLTDAACCALLGVPILSRGALRAVLLLENRLIRGAFTTDRLDAVTLIAGQLAVSMDNAWPARPPPPSTNYARSPTASTRRS